MKKLKKKILECIKNEDGWTFMETLIVIAIILVLSATAGFAAISSLEKSRIAAAKTQIESLATALEAYYIDCGNYPAAEQGLAALRKSLKHRQAPTAGEDRIFTRTLQKTPGAMSTNTPALRPTARLTESEALEQTEWKAAKAKTQT